MKAIETTYRGYRFRSRLEARWAVLFDSIGATWEYEPEGYEHDDTCYLPDFLLHGVKGLDKGTDLYIEVKGVMNDMDACKIDLFSKNKPTLVVGSIPYANSIIDLMDEIENEMDVDITEHPEWPPRNSTATINGGDFPVFIATGMHGGIYLISQYYGDVDVDEEKTLSAYRAARGARFEHGEKGGRR